MHWCSANAPFPRRQGESTIPFELLLARRVRVGADVGSFVDGDAVGVSVGDDVG